MNAVVRQDPWNATVELTLDGGILTLSGARLEQATRGTNRIVARCVARHDPIRTHDLP
jgi:hypothetical protein